MKFTFDLHVRGLHVYQTVWSPNIGEGDLECKHENKNEEDDFVIGTMIFREKPWSDISIVVD